jgi:hypothetical protein
MQDDDLHAQDLEIHLMAVQAVCPNAWNFMKIIILCIFVL